MIFWFGRAPFMSFFTSDQNVMKIGYMRLLLIDNLEFLTGTYEISGGCLRGMGHSFIPAIITMIGSCVFRIIWVSTYFVSHHTLQTLLIIYPISWVFCGTAMHIAYFTMRHKLFKQA
jgi:Na+-driven multidrug efflux pump